METITISIEEYNRLRKHKPNMETLQFIQMNPKDFKQEIINGILEIMVKPKDEESLLSNEQTAEFFGVSIDTVLRWRKKKTIIGYMIGGSVLYKKSELLQALKQIKEK
ncbi:helix-turn-helix domain-containing protein [Flavobacterium sp. GT2N3]|uniref:helix-turn-helix domain-containing protein n=1 Tax=unclassified Flavobacterium TaxID=196869 RepID=UPI003AAF0D02